LKRCGPQRLHISRCDLAALRQVLQRPLNLRDIAAASFTSADSRMAVSMLIRAICYLLAVATVSLRTAGRDGHGVGVDGFSKDKRRQPFNYAIFAQSLEELFVVLVKLMQILASCKLFQYCL
jgi:hypothetical protein